MKHIVIACDGTWKRIDATEPTNVVKLAQAVLPAGPDGVTQIVRYASVNDFGTVINPLLVEGQVHGGVVQGIGQALMERTVYDDSGQLVTGSYMDYQLPRAADAPFFSFERYVATPWINAPPISYSPGPEMTRGEPPTTPTASWFGSGCETVTTCPLSLSGG